MRPSRPSDMTRYATSICVCGKGMYPTRKLAKNAAKRITHRDNLTPYQCDQAEDVVWHVGHSRQWRHTRYHHQARVFGPLAA